MERKAIIARVLPTGWKAEDDVSFGTIITAENSKGFVTVDERLRGFALGMSAVRVRGSYAGRNWMVPCIWMLSPR